MRNYIPSVTGLRAVSIFIVIIFHLNAASALGYIAEVPFPFTVLLDGNFGVNIFFVISGFLITSLLIAEEKTNGTISLKNFYIRRIFRIFPAYYLLLLAYAVLQLFSVFHLSLQSWLSSIFYYKYLVSSDIETAHLWSLSVEEHFYLVWPMIFLLFRKSRVYFAFGIILLVFICRTLSYNNTYPDSIINNWAFIFQRVDAIMIGCLFAMYYDKLSAWLSKLLTLKYLPVLILLLFVNSRYFIDLNRVFKLHLGFILVPLGIGTQIGTVTNLLIALFLLFSVNCKNAWYKFLNSPTIIYIGKLSYSLYLWQQIFIMTTRFGLLNKFPLNIVCAILSALLSYYLVELPFLKVKSRFESVTPQPAYSINV